MAVQRNLSKLKSQLMMTGLAKENNPLFQVINGLIDAIIQEQGFIVESVASGGGSGGGLPNEEYLLSAPSGSLPNSRNLLAGAGVQFDDTTPSERTIDVIGVREVENVVTGSIASGATESGEWAIGATTWQIIQLVKVESDRAGYLVLYASAADRDADTRALPATIDPIAGEGIFLDAAFDSDVVSIDVSPPVVLYNNEAPVVQKIYYRFFNQEATAGVTTFTLTFVVSNGGGGTGGGSVAVAHNLLSATHSDTTPASGVDGDLIIHDTTWKRLPKSTNGRVLTLTAGLPAWSLDGSALSLNASNLASGTVPIARLPIPDEATITTTGNIDDLAIGNIRVLRMNNATLATIRGIAAGVAGQLLTIISVGAGQVDLAHQNTNSAATNRLLNLLTTQSTPIGAGVGRATYQYDGTTQRWRLVNHSSGKLIVPYNSSNFVGTGAMTWTVDDADEIVTCDIIDNLMFAAFRIVNSSIGGTPTPTLQMIIPFGFSGNNDTQIPFNGANAGSTFYGLASAVLTATAIDFYISGSVPNWALSTNDTNIIGSIVISIL